MASKAGRIRYSLRKICLTFRSNYMLDYTHFDHHQKPFPLKNMRTSLRIEIMAKFLLDTTYLRTPEKNNFTYLVHT